jgi:broad specificity phosphatase PhoE
MNSESTVMHSSDQPRAMRTAHLLGCPHGLRPIPDADLRERDLGRYTRTSASDRACDLEWPAIDASYDQRHENGESLCDLEHRVFARLLDLRRTLPRDSTLIVVGHGTCWRLVEAVLHQRRQDPFDEPIPPPLTVLEHPRHLLEMLHEYL